jgi:hypothetical protein
MQILDSLDESAPFNCYEATAVTSRFQGEIMDTFKVLLNDTEWGCCAQSSRFEVAGTKENKDILQRWAANDVDETLRIDEPNKNGQSFVPGLFVKI